MSDTFPPVLSPAEAPVATTPLPAPITTLTNDEVSTLNGVVIPLYLFKIPPKTTSSNGNDGTTKTPALGYKVGIVVDVTIPATGATASNVLYEFDTGGKGFWASQGQFAASDSQPIIPPSTSSANLGAVVTQYSSGITYLGTGVVATVSLPQAIVPKDGAVPSVTTGMAVVETILELSDGSEAVGSFPIFGNFFGDFGVSLQQTTTSVPTLKHSLPSPYNQQVPSSQQPALLSIMAQLGADCFIVDLVTDVQPPKGAVIPGGAVKSGRLILGSSAAFASYFPQYQAMAATGSTYTPPDSTTAITTYEEALITASLALGGNEALNVPVILDTGTPGVMLHSGVEPPTLSASDFTPTQGQAFVVTTQLTTGLTPQEQSLLSFSVGEVIGQNNVEMAKIVNQTSSGAVNTGLNTFLLYQTMYDLANGLIRFPAQSPESIASA